MREVRWERLFPDELEAAFAACPVLYFAYGMCEPHGPQNTLGLDALKAHAIACAAAHEHGGIVAPLDYWHCHEVGIYAQWAAEAIGEVERHWLTSLPPWQHFRNVCYHIRTADVLGFKAAIFLTGHYGPNWRDLKTLIELIQPICGTRLYGLPDFEANHPGFANDDQSTGDHAGRVETSLLWALEPECVDVSRMAGVAPGARPWAMGPDAGESDRRIGERMVADEVRFLGAKAAELLADYDRLQPTHDGLRTFMDVERFWEAEMRPRLPELASLQPATDQYAEIPPESCWRANAAPEVP